jgi:acetyltransferase
MKPASKPSGKQTSDPAHDVLRSERHPLEAVFCPQSVAVIGASDRAGSVGRNVLWNLLSNPFGGTVFPVNPKRPSVLGIKNYPKLADIPEAIELAIVTTPADTVPDVLSECVETGVRAAIVISAGFREMGPEGVEREREVQRRIAGSRLRVIGPNCLGVMNPVGGLNATWAQTIARPGNVAFISQSGALCTAILDWSLHEMVGFSALRRRSPHPLDRVLHGIDRRRPFVHVGGARGVAYQAHHRHQGGPYGKGCPRRGLAHRRADRQR